MQHLPHRRSTLVAALTGVLPSCVIFVLVVAVSLVFVTAPSNAQAPTPSQPRGDAQKGKSAFMAAGCYTCHGTVGQGGAGARLAPNPRPAPAFTAYVRSGRRGWSVAGGMPAYPPSMLSDQTLADIWAYLAAIPAPPPASSIQILKD